MCDQPCDATATSAPLPPCSAGWVLEGAALRRGGISVRDFCMPDQPPATSAHRRPCALPLVPTAVPPSCPCPGTEDAGCLSRDGQPSNDPKSRGKSPPPLPRPCPKLAHKSQRYKNKTALCLHAHFRLPFKPELVSHTLAEEQRGAGVKRQARKINAYFSLAACEGLP